MKRHMAGVHLRCLSCTAPGRKLAQPRGPYSQSPMARARGAIGALLHEAPSCLVFPGFCFSFFCFEALLHEAPVFWFSVFFLFFWVGALLHEDPSYYNCCLLLFEGIDLNNPTKLRENKKSTTRAKTTKTKPIWQKPTLPLGCVLLFSRVALGMSIIWAGLALP